MNSFRGVLMSGGVFVLKDRDTLVPMGAASFATEDEFQMLIARFPALLGAVQGDSNSPRRWLLLGREKGIQSDAGSSDRWALDHLFIDQDGVPTLVEVKRQSDSRLRREVIGQMLDYAANAVLYWSADQLRAQFDDDCLERGKDGAAVVAELVGADGDADGLWQKVKTNLQAGRIRILFVADLIPPEVKRIVEFLNRQMDPAEVLAVELRQYEGEGLRTIVPAVYGLTEEAQQRKSALGPTPHWDRARIFDELRSTISSDLLGVAERIANWIEEKSDQVVFGHGGTEGSMGAGLRHQKRLIQPLQLWTSGRVTLGFGYLEDDRRLLQEWADRVAKVPITLAIKAPKYPSIRLSALPQSLDTFLAAMDWLAKRLQNHTNPDLGNP